MHRQPRKPIDDGEDEFEGMNGCAYCRDRALPTEFFHCPKCDADWHPDDEDEEDPRHCPVWQAFVHAHEIKLGSRYAGI